MTEAASDDILPASVTRRVHIKTTLSFFFFLFFLFLFLVDRSCTASQDIKAKTSLQTGIFPLALAELGTAGEKAGGGGAEGGRGGDGRGVGEGRSSGRE